MVGCTLTTNSRVVLQQLLPDLAGAGEGRVQVHTELVEIIVGEVVKGVKLEGVGGDVLVGGDPFAVRI